MSPKPRTWWLFVALFLFLWLCMIFTVTSVVFATHVDEDLYRAPGCQFYDQPYWRYYGDDVYDPNRIGYMSQRDRATHTFFCQITIT